LQVVTAPNPPTTFTSSISPAKNITEAEHVAEGFKDVLNVVELRTTAKSGVTILVISTSLLVIRKDFVGLAGFLEPFNRLRIIPIGIRMKLDR
jgi:hypothetical protein